MIIFLEPHSRCLLTSLILFQNSDKKIRKERKLERIIDKLRKIYKWVEDSFKSVYTSNLKKNRKKINIMQEPRIKYYTEQRKAMLLHIVRKKNKSMTELLTMHKYKLLKI